MKKVLLVLVGITLLSFIYPGYEVFTGDQRLYLPWIKRDLHPELYPNDPVASIDHLNFSLFDELVVGTITVLGIDFFDTLFLITIVTRYIYFYAIYRLALYFTDHAAFSLFAPLLFMTNKIVFGSAMQTMIYEAHYRTVSLALCLLFLAMYLNRKRLRSLILLAGGFAMNTLTVPPFLLFFVLDTLWRRLRKQNNV